MTSATSTSVTPTADPNAAAVKACATFWDVYPPVGQADVALMRDFSNHVPADQAEGDFKSLLTAAQSAATRMQNVLTPDVPNPPANALRAWVDALGAMIHSGDDMGSNEFRQQDTSFAASDACKPFGT